MLHLCQKTPIVLPLPIHSAPRQIIGPNYVSLRYIFNKNLLFLIRSAIPLFASWFFHCLFFRFGRFLQQSSHPILVPQPEDRQSHKFWWAVPDASVETLTRYSKPFGQFHLRQAELLANPLKLSPIHLCNANALKSARPEALHAQSCYEPALCFSQRSHSPAVDRRPTLGPCIGCAAAELSGMISSPSARILEIGKKANG